MPRPEDIAWKFVVRLDGKRWRCPYCHKVSSGSVTRVKGHFRKQPKEGIASCTKVPEHIRTLMELLLNHELHNKDDIAWKFVNGVEGSKWRCYYCRGEFFGDLTGVKGHLLGVPNEGISICTGVPNHVRTLMWSLLDAVAEEESRGANGQSSMEPQSRHMPTQLLPSFSLETLEYLEPLLPTPWGETNMANFTQQGVIGSNSDQQSQAHHQFHQSSTMPLLVQSSHATEPESCDTEVPDHIKKRNDLDEMAEEESRVVAEEQSREAHGQSSMEPKSGDMPTQDEVAEEEIRDANSQFVTEPYGNFPSPELPPVKSPSTHAIEQMALQLRTLINTGENSDQQPQPECQFHESSTMPSLEQNSLGESSLCSMGALEDGVLDLHDRPDQPERSFESPCPEEMPTNDQQTPRGASLFQDDQLQTPMEVDPPFASRHTTESPIIEATGLQVREVATNMTGPSSSQDMNRGSPIMNVWSICANDEEIRNLKRKMEELDYREAFTKKQMEIESATSSVRKKPRISFENWQKEAEKARNNFQIIGQANAETLPSKAQVETLTREVEDLIEQTLPQTPLIDAKDAKGEAFLVGNLEGAKIRMNIELIWDHLKENQACKLGISGMGGVGKTSIMMEIHNRVLKDATFNDPLFITLSRDFSIYKLQSALWKALEFGVMEDEHEKKRAAMLSERLETKKNCVLILDNVWEHFNLQDVGIPDKAGLKVVLTTRSPQVCSQMDCEQIKIEPLGEEEGWKLFMVELGAKTLTNKGVEKVARKIAKRCAGLPLAIKTLARSMKGENNFCVWQDTLSKLERSQTKHTELGEKVLSVLALSYDRLQDPQVKQCFLFCALFPEDEPKNLIEHFIDEGFLDELDTRHDQCCRGQAIVCRLQNACLLERDHYFVRMHDLIREMALQIKNTAYMVRAEGLERIPHEKFWTEDLEKASLMQGSIKDIPPAMSPNCPRLSTLLLNGSLQLENVQLQDSFFMKLQELKVLNLSECAISKLPDSVSKLAKLKALLLRNCRLLCRIPNLGDLKSLRKLDANGCESLSAVTGLEKLSNLRYLDLSKTGMERLLEGTLSRMVNLQYLKIAGKVKAEEVIQLKALEGLECNFGNVDDFNKYVRRLWSGRYDYRLIVDQENSLWSVTANRYSDHEILPEEKIKDDDDYHDFSKDVQIRSCNYAMGRVGEETNKHSILIPGDVKFFKIRNWRGMTNLSGAGPFRCLEELEITECNNIVVLFGGAGVDEEQVRNTQDSPVPLFPSLEKLKIGRCTKLKYLFGHESRFSLPFLREVFIYECKGIEGMTTSVASPPPPGGPAFPKLKHINVENCGNMKRVVGSEWLPHFPNLTSIEIKDCNNIRELLPYECLLHLSNLECIVVRGCEGIEEIIGGGGESHRGSAPLNTPSSSLTSPFSPLKLKILELHKLPQLKSVGEGALSFIPGAIVIVPGCLELSVRPDTREVQGGEFYEIHKDELRRLFDMSSIDLDGDFSQNVDDMFRRLDGFLQLVEDVFGQGNGIRELLRSLSIQEDESRKPAELIQTCEAMSRHVCELFQIDNDECKNIIQEDDVLRRFEFLGIHEDESKISPEFLRIEENVLRRPDQSIRMLEDFSRGIFDTLLSKGNELRRPDEVHQSLQDGIKRLAVFLKIVGELFWLMLSHTNNNEDERKG